MLEKPNLADDVIIGMLKQQDGIQAVKLDFLPLGNDAGAWVYRVEASGGETYFLKVRTLPLDEITLIIPHWLADQGIKQVVTPLGALDGKLWRTAGEYGLILYPYIQGGTGMQLGLSAPQWRSFGAAVKQLHASILPEPIRGQVAIEAFVPKWNDMVRRIQRRVDKADFRSDAQATLGEFWQKRCAEISQIVRRTEELGVRLMREPIERVLCHADIHTANLLVDPQGDLHIVDWDQPVIAPKERDLMFVVDGSPEEKFFLQGYGPATVNPLALAYYRYEWVIQELGDYAERVFFRDDLGAETVEDSIRGLRQLFDPGDVVEAAMAMEAFLS
jgi:spectinomycin phosphotransferase